jgi:hypothetical protein
VSAGIRAFAATVDLTATRLGEGKSRAFTYGLGGGGALHACDGQVAISGISFAGDTGRGR